MAKSRLVLAVLVSTTAGIVTLAGSQAQAHDPGPAPTAAAAAPVFLAADLRGRNEVPAADPDGHAVAVVRIQGNQVSFALAWRGIAAPTAGHIHVGAAGMNGAVRVDTPDKVDTERLARVTKGVERVVRDLVR